MQVVMIDKKDAKDETQQCSAGRASTCGSILKSQKAIGIAVAAATQRVSGYQKRIQRKVGLKMNN